MLPKLSTLSPPVKKISCQKDISINQLNETEIIPKVQAGKFQGLSLKTVKTLAVEYAIKKIEVEIEQLAIG